jgi:predicted DNA-binding transcriptional regulator YafY
MSRISNRIARLRQLEELLLHANRGMSVIELADHLGVNRRTIYRDLEFLSVQSLPLWQDGGTFGINRIGYLPNIRLTYQEAMALVLAGLLLARSIDEHNPTVVSALRRLSTALPEFPAQHLLRAADRVEKHPQNPVQVAVLEAILEAWGKGCKVKIAYRSPKSGSLRERVLSPYALEPTASGLYVIGYDDWSAEIRTFKLERLESARVLQEPYSIPEDFDHESQQRSSWGIMTGTQVQEVILRFVPSARPFVQERQWHPSQQVEETEDGGCLLRIWVSEPLEMQPWIRSWGAQVEVLAPLGLRERVADELLKAAEQYSNRDHPQEVQPGSLEFSETALDVQSAGAARFGPSGFFLL